MTNNLGRTELADGQTTNQYATVNTMVGRVDAALTSSLIVTVSTAGTYTVSADNIEKHYEFVLTNHATPPVADFAIVMDQDFPRGIVLITNLTSFVASITATGQTLPPVLVQPNTSVLCSISATDIQAVGGAAAGGGLSIFDLGDITFTSADGGRSLIIKSGLVQSIDLAAPIGAITSSKWRIKVVDSNDPTYCSIGDFEFRTTPGVPETMLTVGGDSTGSTASYFGGTSPDLMFDGATSPRYAFLDTGGFPKYARFNFTVPRAVAEVCVKAPSTFYAEMAKNMVLQYWDGAAWVDSFTIPAQTAWGASETRLFAAPTTPGFVRDAPSDGAIYGRKNGAWAQSPNSWKQAVRAASNVNHTLASAIENGDVIDGVTLATGDRVLLKAQTAGAENGIWVVKASGTPDRAVDANTGPLLVNATVYVSEGSTNADTAWVCTTNAPITPGTTALVWAQVGGGVALPTGGTINQVLKKNSSTDGDASWATLTATTPWDFSPPLASHFPTLIGTVTPTITDDTDVGLLFDGGSPVGTDASRGAVKTIGSPTGAWKATGKFAYTNVGNAYGGLGIILHDTAANRNVTFKVEQAGTTFNLSVAQLSHPTGFNANVYTQQMQDGPKWLQIEKISTTLYFRFSNDGKMWAEVYTQTATAWLTNNPNRLGLGVFYARTTGPNAMMSCSYWSDNA